MSFDSNRRLKAFTLLEIVLSVAVFTIIAAPILGLLAMTAKTGNESSNVVRAEELTRVVANELRTAIEGGALSWDFTATNVGLFASEDLKESALDSDAAFAAADKYFFVDVQDPVGVILDPDSINRMVLLDVRWPAFVRGVDNRANMLELNQIIVPVVLTKP